MAVAERARFTEEDKKHIDRIVSLIQTDGKSASAEVDPDFLLEDGKLPLFFMTYFPTVFFQWERINQQFTDFLESQNEGIALLPGGVGKTSTLTVWCIYMYCKEPQVSIIYCGKSDPIAKSWSRALMNQLEGNTLLTKHFGQFKSAEWSETKFTIKQRPFISLSPSMFVFGTQGPALGNRCNIMIVDDPVTTYNSASELDRAKIYQWYTDAASTCASPLPLKDARSKYLKKQFLIGTTFHFGDLFNEVRRANPDIPFLHLRAVEDYSTGRCVSPRFCWRDTEELKRSAETDAYDAQLLDDINRGKVLNLHKWRKDHGSPAFLRRYQNEVSDPTTQRFPRLWLEGGDDEYAPSGGYPGCLDKSLTMSMPAREGWKYVTGFDPQSGSTTRDAARFACVTLGADPKNPVDIYCVGIDYGKYALESDNPERTTQTSIIFEHVKKYGSRIALEQNGVQAVYAGVLRKEAQRLGMTISISPHWTSKGRIIDPELGIEAMGPMIENGKLHLPYHEDEPSDRRKADELIEEFVNWGVYPTKDIVMAFWFAWRVLQRSLKQFSAQSHHNEKLPVWREYRPDLIFPEHWTPSQKRAYLTGKPADVEEEDEEL